MTRLIRFSFLTQSTGIVGVTVLCAALCAEDALAQAPLAMANPEMRNSLARDPGGHWTPENLAQARPLPLPRPRKSRTELTQQQAPTPESMTAQAATAGTFSTQVDGKLPPREAEVAPNLADRLFSPGSQPAQSSTPEAQAAEFTPFDAGTEKAFFSSSRLVPVDARLEYPYRAAGKLFFEVPGQGSFICSGAVIAPRLVLTAGHCVHKGSGGAAGYHRRFLFVPAYHQGQAPYQAWNFTWVITTGSWISGGGGVPNKADFAILEMEDRRFGSEVKTIGQATGTLGYRVNGLNPNHTKKVGYPANLDNGEVMHQVDSGHHKAAEENTVLYGSDMRGGSSGGPWIENFGVQAAGQTGGLQPNPNRVVGVTSYGFVSEDPKVQGSSILNQEFTTILNAACAHRAGNC